MKRDQNKCPLLPRHCTIDCRANLIGGECQAPIIEESNNSEKEENEELVAYYMKDREGRWILVSKGLYDSALNNRENARQFGYNEFKIVIGSGNKPKEDKQLKSLQYQQIRNEAR